MGWKPDETLALVFEILPETHFEKTIEEVETRGHRGFNRNLSKYVIDNFMIKTDDTFL